MEQSGHPRRLFKESTSFSLPERIGMSCFSSLHSAHHLPQLPQQMIPEIQVLARAQGWAAGWLFGWFSLAALQNRIPLDQRIWDTEQVDVPCAWGFGTSMEEVQWNYL